MNIRKPADYRILFPKLDRLMTAKLSQTILDTLSLVLKQIIF